MSNNEYAEIVADGMAIIEQSRHTISAWAESIGAGLTSNRTAEKLLLAKQTMERMGRIAHALDALIRYEEKRLVIFDVPPMLKERRRG